MAKGDQIYHLLSTFLLSESIILNSKKTLFFGTSDGTLPTFLAELVTVGQVWVTASTASTINLIRKSAQVRNLNNLHVFPDLAEPDSYLHDPPTTEFDTAIILLPKGRKVSRRWLSQAYRLMSPKGDLYLAGANDEGVQAVAKDASELFGPAIVMGYKKGTRLYHIPKVTPVSNHPDWTQQPGIAYHTWNEYHTEVRGYNYTIHTLPGVFSFDHLDEGTRMLLECMQVPIGCRALDLGCGCGIIGMLAINLGASHVDLADDHILSVSSTFENLRVNNLPNASVYASDLYTNLADFKYDVIFSNPPFHTGKDVDYQVAHTLIAEGYQRLNTGGSLQIVANRFIRYDRLMDQIFRNVSVVKSNPGFHVLYSKKT